MYVLLYEQTLDDVASFDDRSFNTSIELAVFSSEHREHPIVLQVNTGEDFLKYPSPNRPQQMTIFSHTDLQTH